MHSSLLVCTRVLQLSVSNILLLLPWLFSFNIWPIIIYVFKFHPSIKYQIRFMTTSGFKSSALPMSSGSGFIKAISTYSFNFLQHLLVLDFWVVFLLFASFSIHTSLAVTSFHQFNSCSLCFFLLLLVNAFLRQLSPFFFLFIIKVMRYQVLIYAGGI